MTSKALALTAVVLMAGALPVAAAAQTGSLTGQAEGSAYTGAHVSYETAGSAIVDYAVASEVFADSIAVQSQSEVDSSLGLGVAAGLSAVANIQGSALSMGAESQTSATVQAESGATIETHDNHHGSFVVHSGNESQYVEIGVDESATVSQESDGRVVVTNENGSQAAIVVAGDGNGNVTVNDDGNVTAAVESDGRLVFRGYPDNRTDEDESQEQMIENGTAAASVYVSENDDGEAVNDTVSYDSNTSVTVEERASERVEVTVNRTAHEGRVILTSVSEAAISSVENLEVTIDGEAAVEASSRSELEAAANGGDSSMYMVQETGASGHTDVLVAFNHFSERNMEMSSQESNGSDGDDPTPTEGGDGNDGDENDGDGNDGGDDTPTEGTGPGFGIFAVLTALASILGWQVRGA